MILLRILQITFFIIFWGLLVTQVILPLWNDTQIFPIFRKKPKDLQPEDSKEEKKKQQKPRIK